MSPVAASRSRASARSAAASPSASRAEGAALTVTDVNPAKRDLALELGADWMRPGRGAPRPGRRLRPRRHRRPPHRRGHRRARRQGRVRSRRTTRSPTHSGAERLARRGILYAPDFVVNAGGVIYLDLEAKQLGSRDEIMERVAAIGDTVRRIFDEAESRGVTPLEAAEGWPPSASPPAARGEHALRLIRTGSRPRLSADCVRHSVGMAPRRRRWHDGWNPVRRMPQRRGRTIESKEKFRVHQPVPRCRDPRASASTTTSSRRSTDDDAARVALIDPATGAETTYGALRAQVDAFAGALAARGVGTETVLGLLCPNVPAFATVFHGILRAGAVVTTINSLYTAGEIEKQLRDAGATWLITVSPLLPQASTAAEAVGIPHERVIVLDGAHGHPNLRELLTEGSAAPEVSFDPATHVAVLPYSSGTTGIPKGVMLTHRNLVANVQQCRCEHRPARHRPGARGAAVLPHLRHDGAAEPGAAPAREPRHDAEVRSRRVPHEHPEVRLHLPLHRAAHRGRAGEASDRRPVRHLDRAHRVLGRRAARRRDRRGRGPAHRRAHDAGLRHERAEPGLARDARRPPRHPGELGRDDAAEPGLQAHRHRDRRGDHRGRRRTA